MLQDRKTRVALKEAHLENALAALRKAITASEDDRERETLTSVAGFVAQARRDAGQALADMHEAEARYATVLEA